MAKRGAGSTAALRPAMDPVTFEVVRNALLNLTEEMAVTVRRAAFSTNIKTRADFSCAYFDQELRCVAQSFAQPAHLVSMATIAPTAVREFGPERIEPGDAILVNDPHRGASHLNDITVVSPVDVDGRDHGDVVEVAGSAMGIVDHQGIAHFQAIAAVFADRRRHDGRHGDQVRRLGEGLSDAVERTIEDGTGEIGPCLDVGRIGGAANGERHFLGHVDQRVADHLEGDRVDGRLHALLSLSPRPGRPRPGRAWLRAPGGPY